MQNVIFIVPPPPPVIRSSSGRVLLDMTEPMRENSMASLVCQSIGGDPLPRLTWWDLNTNSILDDVVEKVDAKSFKVQNRLRLKGLSRDDDGRMLACRAMNTNLTNPITTKVKINMVCKYQTFIALLSSSY